MWDQNKSETIKNDWRLAYLLGYPTVDMYKVLRQYALDIKSPEYRAPLNQLHHIRQVATPEDKAIIAPNLDTPYSTAWLDLRHDAIILSVPTFESQRYVSVTIFDLYSNIVKCISPRTNGRLGGQFLIVGPQGHENKPKDVKEIITCPTQLAFVLIRTQLLNENDLPQVHQIQDRFQLRVDDSRQNLTQILPNSPKKFLDLRSDPYNLDFFQILSWMWQWMPILAEDQALREELVKLGLSPGEKFNLADEKEEQMVKLAMIEAYQEMTTRLQTVRSSAELFGSREFYHGQYLDRALGAMIGIFGNSGEEYLGPGYPSDSEGRPFDGRFNYQLYFKAGNLPPVSAFWSVTVYDQMMLLYDNEINRQVINSTMLHQLKKDEAGGITIYIQNKKPNGDKASNWLPAPPGKFTLTLRCYQPQQPLINGEYKIELPIRIN